MTEQKQPADFEVVSGPEAFGDSVLELVRAARSEVCLLSQELERRIYGSDAFLDALRTFVLQHRNTRVRILVNNQQKAIQGNTGLVEFGRSLSTFVEFREVPPERQPATPEEYLITDGRQMLLRDKPGNLDAKLYRNLPGLVRLRQKDFDQVWADATTAQELRRLRL